MAWIAVLKDWQDLISGILTIVAAFIGGAYVIRSTNKQVSAVSEQFHETIRPFVIAKLGTYAGVVFSLEIENIGQSPASNLTLNIDKDFFQFGEKQNNIRSLEAFNRVVPNFAPGEKMVFLLSQGFNMDNVENGNDLTPHKFTIKVRYQFQDHDYDESYLIDTEHYSGVLALKGQHDLLSDIATHLKEISTGLKSLVQKIPDR